MRTVLARPRADHLSRSDMLFTIAVLSMLSSVAASAVAPTEQGAVAAMAAAPFNLAAAPSPPSSPPPPEKNYCSGLSDDKKCKIKIKKCLWKGEKEKTKRCGKKCHKDKNRRKPKCQKTCCELDFPFTAVLSMLSSVAASAVAPTE